MDASIGAAFGRLIGQSVGPAGLQVRSEGLRSRLASCLNMLNRCCPRQAFRSHAVPLMLLLLRRRAPACDRQVQAEGSMAARCAVTRCAGAFPMCVPYVCPAMDEQVPARPRRAAVPRVRSGPGHATRQKNDMFGWRNHDMGVTLKI